MFGKAEAGLMVCTPGPEMLKSMVSAPAWLLASMMACRSEPLPESFVLVTVKVEATTKRSIEQKNKTTKIRARGKFLIGREHIDFWRQGALEVCVSCASFI